MIYRHGDVIIRKIERVKGKLVKDNSSTDVIVAEGEVTGHAHRFKTENGTVEIFDSKGTLYIKVVTDTATITHEEHQAITIPKGKYVIEYQREYVSQPESGDDTLNSPVQNWRRIID